MCYYLANCGPLRGRPPDRYPLHHGISARKSAVKGESSQASDPSAHSVLLLLLFVAKESLKSIEKPLIKHQTARAVLAELRVDTGATRRRNHNTTTANQRAITKLPIQPASYCSHRNMETSAGPRPPHASTLRRERIVHRCQ